MVFVVRALLLVDFTMASNSYAIYESLNSYSFVTTEAIVVKMHGNRMRIVVKANMKFH